MAEILDQVVVDICEFFVFDPPAFPGRYIFYAIGLILVLMAVGWIRGWHVNFIRFKEIGVAHVEVEEARAIRRRRIRDDFKEQAAKDPIDEPMDDTLIQEQQRELSEGFE